MLENIKSPSDIKDLSYEKLDELSGEIRKTIIESVSKNGGHLASNLGMVETTIAIHRVFDSPDDKIVFDVSHQCYTHKLLTGRYDKFDTLRKFGGISGFTNRTESEHDILNEGHSGSSISAALGIATANKLSGKDDHVIAVVGDGSLTNGMVYEALNNCADKKLNLIIIINDNEMSISKNVGGLHKYLTKIRTSNGYFRFKRKFEYYLSAVPLIGNSLARVLKLAKDAFRRLFVRDTIFEELGLVYVGPVDGHDIEKMSRVLEEAKQKHQCCVVHTITKKGFGYSPAENEPGLYHGVGHFDVAYGIDPDDTGVSFSSKVGEILCDMAEKDGKLCAITAAMCDGTGLTEFAKRYPRRFFDVGIAEEHAVTFASGLAAAGMKPMVTLYSTFSQRVYDQLQHDVAVQGLPLTLLIDRAGLVPNDGITHQGIFDYSVFTTIPGTVIYAPATYEELRFVLENKTNNDSGITVIRYPKGDEVKLVSKNCADADMQYFGDENADVVILTYGRLTDMALEVMEKLKGKYKVGVLKLLKVFPLDFSEIADMLYGCKLLYILDEGFAEGSLSEKIRADITFDGRIISHNIDSFVEHGSLPELMNLCGFTVGNIENKIITNINQL